jgi:hypothetical protein
VTLAKAGQACRNGADASDFGVTFAFEKTLPLALVHIDDVPLVAPGTPPIGLDIAAAVREEPAPLQRTL